VIAHYFIIALDFLHLMFMSLESRKNEHDDGGVLVLQRIEHANETLGLEDLTTKQLELVEAFREFYAELLETKGVSNISSHTNVEHNGEMAQAVSIFRTQILEMIDMTHEDVQSVQSMLMATRVEYNFELLTILQNDEIRQALQLALEPARHLRKTSGTDLFINMISNVITRFNRAVRKMQLKIDSGKQPASPQTEEPAVQLRVIA